jgi:hypothetical protein
MLHYPSFTRILIRAVCCLSLVAGGLIGCTKNSDTAGYTDNKGCADAETPQTNSANMLMGSAISDRDIRATILTAVASMTTTPQPRLSADSINIRRCPCDGNLLNITLPGGWTITGVDGDPVAVKPPTGGESRDVGLPIVPNMVGNNYPTSAFIDKNGENGKPSDKFTIPTPTVKNPAIKIAIFDSGLDSVFLPAVILGAETYLCTSMGALDPATKSKQGWDFMPGGTLDSPLDDHPQKHGSRVAHLVAQQFNGGKIPVSITPFKVLNKENQGDLFGLVCAMETARKNNFKVFNMSLGYYGAEDQMLETYVKRATDAKIWIVAAAGNHYIDPITPADTTRNLSARTEKFYPAWFAKTNSRVLAATTVHLSEKGTLVACQQQNYDRQYVVGVKEETDNTCRFTVFGDKESGTMVFGTSYAAPVLTGWLGKQLRNPVNAIADNTGNRAVLLRLLPSAASGNQVYRNRYLIPNPMPVSPYP